MAWNQRNCMCCKRRRDSMHHKHEDHHCKTPTTSAELYGVTTNRKPPMQVCCDNEQGCRPMNMCKRCPFWPNFAHPRWLSCRELYNVPVSSSRDRDDRDDRENGNRNRNRNCNCNC